MTFLTHKFEYLPNALIWVSDMLRKVNLKTHKKCYNTQDVPYEICKK